jgi:uncharacterized lipoprotein
MNSSLRSVLLVLVVVEAMVATCTLTCSSVVTDRIVEKSRWQENPVTQEYPLERDELWQMAMMFCGKEFGVHSSDKEDGSIETEWITEEYRPEETPPGFLEKMKSCGAPTSPNEVKWCGMRHKFLILILPLTGERSRIEVEARIQGYNYGYQMWRWWNSKGTLERLLLSEIEKSIQVTP